MKLLILAAALLVTPAAAQTFGDTPATAAAPFAVTPSGSCLRASCMPVVTDKQAAWDRALQPDFERGRAARKHQFEARCRRTRCLDI